MPPRSCPQDPPETPVVALVLGAAVWPGGEPSPTLRRRALHAAALFADGRVGHIVGCGGIGRHPPSEAEVIRRICLEAGVPADCLAMEATSSNTLENIAFSLPHLRRIGATGVALVTDGYHRPRARLILRHFGVRAVDIPDPPRPSITVSTLRAQLREIPAYLWYLTGLPFRLHLPDPGPPGQQP